MTAGFAWFAVQLEKLVFLLAVKEKAVQIPPLFFFPSHSWTVKVADEKGINRGRELEELNLLQTHT